jgi:hypothetical protein
MDSCTDILVGSPTVEFVATFETLKKLRASWFDGLFAVYNSRIRTDQMYKNLLRCSQQTLILQLADTGPRRSCSAAMICVIVPEAARSGLNPS